MRRPEPVFKLHDDTAIYARAPDGDGWDVFSISRKTGNSIFINTPDGPVQLDRVALERTGQVKRLGRVFYLVDPRLPPLENRRAA